MKSGDHNLGELISQLARMKPADVDAILSQMEHGQKIAVQRLLAGEEMYSPSDCHAVDMLPIGLSDWLVPLVKGARAGEGNVTPMTRETVIDILTPVSRHADAAIQSNSLLTRAASLLKSRNC